MGHEDLACLLADQTSIENLTWPTLSPLSLAIKNSSNKREPIKLVKRIMERIKREVPSPTREEVLKSILTKPDKNKETILNIAIDNNQLNIVEYLIKEYQSLNLLNLEDKNGYLPIHYAAKTGSVHVLHILARTDSLTCSPASSKTVNTPLHIAASNNKHRFIKEYLDLEKLQSKSNASSEEYAHVDYVPSYKSLNADKQTPLFSAIMSGHSKCVEILVNECQDIDLDAQDVNGNTM